MPRSKVNLNWSLVILFAFLAVMAIPSGVLAADTILGNYEDTPYKDIAEIYNFDFKDGFIPRTYVKIPEKYIFSTDKLERTVTINDREWQDIVIVSRYKNGSYLVYDMFEQKGPETDVFFENLSSESNANISEEQLKESVNNAYKAAKREAIDDFLAQYWEYPFGQGGGGPIEPIVSINGKPWQETEWKDYIITHIHESLYPTDPLVTNNEYWEVFLNQNNNGKAKEVIEAIEKQAIILKTNPQNTGIVNQVVLTLNKKEVLVYRDGKAEIHTLDVAPEAPDGITMVPLRGVLDFLGAELNYDGPARTVSVQDGDILVRLTIGEKKAVINGAGVSLIRPAEIKNERTLIPLRFVAENLHYKVVWDPDKQQILISK